MGRRAPRDAQLPARHAHLLEAAEDLLRHPFRQIDEAVIFTDIDLPDVAALEPRLVGDRTDNVAGLHAMHMTHLHPEPLVRDVIRIIPPALTTHRRLAVPALGARPRPIA